MASEKKWWEETPSILSSDYESIYGINDDVTNSEVQFLINITSLTPQTRILDLCCGTGRHSIRLAELGFNVTGQDISPEFLRVANEEASKLALSINWINKDMRDIPLEDYFDLIFIMFGAWGYFEEDQENYKVFKAIHRALKIGGHFVLDFFNYDWIRRNFQPKYWVEREIGYYLEKRELDSNTGRLNTESKLIKRSGSILEWETSTRAFSFQEIKDMLRQAGFSITHIYGNVEGKTFDMNCPRMLIHVQKSVIFE